MPEHFEYPSLRQGLVGAWCPSLGVTGLTLIDRSGRGSHGTLLAPSATSWSASGDGLSVAFDGTQGATLPFSATFGKSATLSLWVKRINQTSPTIADSGFFVANLPDGGQQSHYPYQSFIYCRLLRTNRVNGLTTLIDLTKWHNFCVTTDGTNYTIYQAGRILSLTAAESTVKLASPLRVTELFRGNIDDIRLYDRALTLAEIRLLASRRGIGLTPTRVRPALKPVTTVSFAQSASSRRMATSSLRQGLVGAWCPSLGASGLTLIDRSGRNNHGTLTNMGGQNNWRASGSGVAIKTDGVDDWVSASRDVMPLGSAARTLSCWVNKPNNTTYGVMLDAGAVSPMNRCLFMVIGAGGYSTLVNQSIVVEFNTTSAGTSSTIPLNQWVHLAAIVSGTMGETRIFINGAAATMNFRGPMSNVVNTTTSQLGLFGRSTSASYGESLYDDLRIYSRVLTLAEIRLLASRRGIGLTDSQVRRPTTQVKPRVTVVAASSRRMANTTSSLRQGLVGAWCPSLRGSGGVLPNLARQSNNGSHTGSITASTGGTALDLTTSQSASVGSAASLYPSLVSFSYSGWFRFRSFPNAYSSLFGTDGGSNFQFNCFVKINGKLAVYCGSTSLNSAYDGTGAFTLSANVWYHLAFVFLGGVELTGYVNGQRDATVSSPISSLTASTSTVRMGFITASARSMNAQLDDIRLYSRALTLAEIRLLASRRGIGLTDSQVRRPAVDAASTLYVKKDGVWVPTIPYTKSNGVWGPATPLAKNSDVWKG